MFKILAVTLVAALVAGRLAGGRVGRLADTRFDGVPFLLGSLVVALLPLFVEMPDWMSRAMTTVANVVVIVFLVVNLRRRRGLIRAGLALMALGWALNAVVIAANGGMPLSPWAYEQSGQSGEITAGEGGFYKIVVTGPDTVLRPVGDVIPIRAVGQVVSIGDVLLVLGIGVAVTGAMRATPPLPSPREPARPAEG